MAALGLKIPSRSFDMRRIAILLFFLHGLIPLPAASQAETRAFTTAIKAFNDKFYGNAEKVLAEFVVKFPESEHRAEAILYQAKARFYQTNYAGAIELLQGQSARAGAQADQYLYLIGHSFFEKGEFKPAAEQFHQLIEKFPQSPLRLEALYDEALCAAQLKNWSDVISLLQKSDGNFQTSARSQTNNDFIARGQLLLADALVTQQKFSEAENILRQLGAGKLDAEFSWRRQFLLSRAQLAQNRALDALQNITNLLTNATGVGKKEIVAESVRLHGEILERLNQLPAAVQVYERNLAEGLPVELRREALLKTIDLTLAQGKRGETLKLLESFGGRNTNDAILDLVRLTLGELQLQEFFEATTNGSNTVAVANRTNLIELALTNFDRVIGDFPESRFLPKAFLDRGWCRWVREEFEPAGQDFQRAAETLTNKEDQAIARFKFADTLFQRGELAAAITNYNLLLTGFENVSAIRKTLFDQALYQIVRAALASGDEAAAAGAVGRIIAWYPDNFYSDRAVLLAGQDLNRRGKSSEAAELFSEFRKRFPGSSMAAEVRLALARTHGLRGDWRAAIAEYDQWVKDFPSGPLLPQAEYSRAMAWWHQGGNETNALNLLTNFVARFPTNILAAQAQNCIAEFYFNRDEFAEAERNYQLLYQNFNPPIELAAHARLSAGLAALRRQGTSEARKYFSDLLSDTNTPANIAAETYFVLGDTIFEQFLANTNRPPDETKESLFNESVAAFTRIPKNFPTNALVARAWGRIGDCYCQWAVLKPDPKAWDVAMNAYSNVVNVAPADAAARNQAEIGWGRIYEARQQPHLALDHYLKVLYESDSPEGDPFWLSQAGQAAAAVCENLQEWEQALNVYKRLLNRVPAMKNVLEKPIERVRLRVDAAK